MDDRQRDEARRILDRHIQVYLTKDAEKNRKRQRDKESTIRWIMDRLENPILPAGTANKEQPPDTHIFGDLWVAMRD